MAERAIVPTSKTYAELRRAVEATLVHGQREIDRAKLETYWRTGALIDRHLAAEERTSSYGTQTMRRLAEDLKYEETVLYRCLRFARIYPIFAARRNLLWGHYRVLIDIADDVQRRSLELEADRREWTTTELEQRVRALNAVNVTPAKDGVARPIQKLLKPLRGTPGLHPIVDRGLGLAIDLGFMFYHTLTADQQKRLAIGDIVRLDDSGVRKIPEATRADLFTYPATIRKVIDGDTLLIALQVSPRNVKEMKLRLRGLDCPEISTAAGLAAKAFVEKLLKPGDEVIISTTKPDKYDRYLADVFIAPDGAKLSAIRDQLSAQGTQAAGELFLNNALLEGGYAVRYDGGAKEE